MKRISISFFVIIVFSIYYSCKGKYENLCIDNLINNYPDYKIYIIIPASICKSCGSTYNKDMMEAYKSNQVNIVFNCEVNDTFMVNHYFSNLSKKHIIIDTLHQYKICDNIPESIYPAIIFMNKNKKIDKIEYYNITNTHTYENIRKHLF